MSDLAGPLKPLFLNLPEAITAPEQVISRTPRVKEISDKHKWIVGAMASGFKAREVALMFDVTEQYAYEVNNWEHPVLDQVKKVARDRVTEGIEDLGNRIRFRAEEALDRTVQIMRSDDISNARLAAKDIMDRAGYGAVKKTAVVKTEVPSTEFVEAVNRMNEANEAASRSSEWEWKVPVKEVPAPVTSAIIAREK